MRRVQIKNEKIFFNFVISRNSPCILNETISSNFLKKQFLFYFFVNNKSAQKSIFQGPKTTSNDSNLSFISIEYETTKKF